MASPAKLSDLPDRTDVLVVGAGPAGLTMAVSLVQLGVDCVIIDRKPAVAAGSKAAAGQPRALGYLHRVGGGAKRLPGNRARWSIFPGSGWRPRWSTTASAVADSRRRMETGRCCGRR